ncbi:hypothetical protein BDZ94DRAFT_1160523, partial [Collybia nuda]
TRTACDLQACLNKNTYKPERCDKVLRSLYECCQRMYDERGDDAEASACPQANIVKRWIKDHPGTTK